jgi:FixJ family two-component response regulator
MGDIPMTVRAMKAGAVEFLTKPFRDQDLLDAIQQALERDRTRPLQEAEIAKLRERYEPLTSREPGSAASGGFRSAQQTKSCRDWN